MISARPPLLRCSKMKKRLSMEESGGGDGSVLLLFAIVLATLCAVSAVIFSCADGFSKGKSSAAGNTQIHSGGDGFSAECEEEDETGVGLLELASLGTPPPWNFGVDFCSSLGCLRFILPYQHRLKPSSFGALVVEGKQTKICKDVILVYVCLSIFFLWGRERSQPDECRRIRLSPCMPQMTLIRVPRDLIWLQNEQMQAKSWSLVQTTVTSEYIPHLFSSISTRILEGIGCWEKIQAQLQG
ncbi:hypothetical protein BHM03_00042690 [Ensete ventricosum]|nr:hypothetical protein BHM03_00042690 [Ensete ventricosum]